MSIIANVGLLASSGNADSGGTGSGSVNEVDTASPDTLGTVTLNAPWVEIISPTEDTTFTPQVGTYLTESLYVHLVKDNFTIDLEPLVKAKNQLVMLKQRLELAAIAARNPRYSLRIVAAAQSTRKVSFIGADYVWNIDGTYAPPKAINVTSSYPTVIDVQLMDGVGIVMSQAYPALKGDPGDSDVSGSVMGGNWTSNTGSDFSSASAYLSANGVTTWKTTALLSKVPNAQYQLVFSCSLQALPADVNGVLLPYTLNTLQSSVNAGAMAAVITLTVFGDATQLFDPTTGVYGPLGTVDEIAYDPKYTLNYWWKPTDANLLVLQEKLAEVSPRDEAE